MDCSAETKKVRTATWMVPRESRGVKEANSERMHVIPFTQTSSEDKGQMGAGQCSSGVHRDPHQDRHFESWL